jgi:hypothetical protein
MRKWRKCGNGGNEEVEEVRTNGLVREIAIKFPFV